MPSKGTQSEVIDALCHTIDQVLDDSIKGIGLGVPSVVDIEEGIVYDVQNIPSWKEVHLKSILQEKYKLPVFLNNDANCFALGEKYFGEGRGFKNMMGLIIGTGLAAGIIINDKIYNGYNCGAGEFGMIPYLDEHFEYYASGQFFENVHGTSGLKAFQRAQLGESKAIEMYHEYGKHLGSAVNAILYSIDPEVIILGGSVSQSYELFKDSMWEQIGKLVYRSISERITIKVSTRPDIAVLGAAALYFDAHSGTRSVSNATKLQITNE